MSSKSKVPEAIFEVSMKNKIYIFLKDLKKVLLNKKTSDFNNFKIKTYKYFINLILSQQ